MRYVCSVIQDLLPLYLDKICSEESKQMVEEHLEECENCNRMLDMLKDITYEESLQEERDYIVDHHTKKVKRKSLLVGICLSAVLMIPILVCLICNLAIGHGLDWFFIVLSSLMVFASLTVVPLIAEGKKGMWTLASFMGSLTLLLLTCCIYSRGDWFWVAATPILFGMTVLFLPYVLYQVPQRGIIKRHKAFLCMIADTILLYAVIIICGFYSNSRSYWRIALVCTSVSVVFIWIVFLVIRYVKVNYFIKSGICVLCFSLFVGFINDIINWSIDGIWRNMLVSAKLPIWYDVNLVSNARIHLCMLIVGVVIGTGLMIAGLLRTYFKKR